VEHGYKVTEVGSWTVGSTDGFSRKDQRVDVVKRVQVGSETWLIAN
jgi:hypothetical protein